MCCRVVPNLYRNLSSSLFMAMWPPWGVRFMVHSTGLQWLSISVAPDSSVVNLMTTSWPEVAVGEDEELGAPCHSGVPCLIRMCPISINSGLVPRIRIQTLVQADMDWACLNRDDHIHKWLSSQIAWLNHPLHLLATLTCGTYTSSPEWLLLLCLLL